MKLLQHTRNLYYISTLFKLIKDSVIFAGSFSFIFLKGGIDLDRVYKEVYFDKYCKSCKYKNLKEDEDPCHDCLNEPSNLYSHKPVNYVEKEK